MPYELQCSDVIPGCEWRATGETEEDTIEEYERHAREAHSLLAMPDDIAKKAAVSIQSTN